MNVGSGASPRFRDVPVLSEAECDDVWQRLDAHRGQWIRRGPIGSGFLTVGRNVYMDLADSTDPDADYFGVVEQSNSALRALCGDVLERLARAVARATDLTAHFDERLAVPGFHIWLSHAIPRAPTASLHFDLQYEPLVRAGVVSGPFSTLSFTMPIRLPVAGSHLRVWDATYDEVVSGRLNLAHVDVNAPTERLVYQVGDALLHSGQLLHQIGETPSVVDSDVRVMLQGHAIVQAGRAILYW